MGSLALPLCHLEKTPCAARFWASLSPVSTHCSRRGRDRRSELLSSAAATPDRKVLSFVLQRPGLPWQIQSRHCQDPGSDRRCKPRRDKSPSVRVVFLSPSPLLLVKKWGGSWPGLDIPKVAVVLNLSLPRGHQRAPRPCHMESLGVQASMNTSTVPGEQLEPAGQVLWCPPAQNAPR